MLQPSPRACSGVLALALTSLAAPAAAQTDVADYAQLDNTPREWTNFNVPATRATVVVRPFGSSADYVYSCNTAANFVAEFDNDVDPPRRFHTPPGPVALAYLDRGEGSADDALLVVCRSSNALVLVRPGLNGTIERLLEVRSEPGDIVVDENEEYAYVSCVASDEVVQVDIDPSSPTYFTELDRWSIPSKRPTWLFLHYPDPVEEPDAHLVYVTPTISGNNTTVIPANGNAGQPPSEVQYEDRVINLSQLNLALPDQDVFVIDPVAGTVDAVARETGALGVGHGINPVTGEYWAVATDLINDFPNQDAESELPSDFAQIQLCRFVLGGTYPPTLVVSDLNDTVGMDEELSGPWSLTFGSDGVGFISGTMTDNVHVLGTYGARLGIVTVPEGSIPRYVALSPDWPATKNVFVHCWGTNKVERFDLTSSYTASTSDHTYDLGIDPAPDIVREGRAIFYDAHLSADNIKSCNTCHFDGGADQLAWTLSDLPRDNKGPMVTQLLTNIEGTGPFHWRGERARLDEFNKTDHTSAFAGLIGTECPLSPSEFAAFEAFVRSLAAPANPKQQLDRRVHGVEAVEGQIDFQTEPTEPFSLACVECHAFPTGTNADIVPENGSWIPARTHMDVAALNSGNLTLKDQPTINVSGYKLGILGTGLLHNGGAPSLHDFVSDTFGLTQAVADNITAFVEQFDQGMSPAAQFARLMTPANASSVADDVQNAMDQADATVAGCGIVVMRASNNGYRWYYAGSDDFEPDDSFQSPRTLQSFVNECQQQGTRFVFYGTPPVNGRLMGIDFDNDGLPNKDERTLGADDFDPDSDGDGLPDGYEVANGTDPTDDTHAQVDLARPALVGSVQQIFCNARTFKGTFEADEPVTFDIVITSPSGAPALPTVSSDVLARRHTFVVPDLVPSDKNGSLHTYNAELTITDLAGKVQSGGPIAFSFQPTRGCIEMMYRITGLTWDELETVGDCSSGSSQSVQAEMRIEETGTGGTPVGADGFIVFGYVIMRDLNATLCDPDLTSWSVVENDDWTDLNPMAEEGFFEADEFEYKLLGGAWDPDSYHEFVVSTVSQSGGYCTFDIEVDIDGLACGDEYGIRVLGILPSNGEPYSVFNFGSWSMPETDVENRQITRTFD